MIEAVWYVCQLLTAMAYFHIPYEMRGWVRGIDIMGLQRIVALFVGFIVFCGLHHAVMLWTMRHDINPVQLVSDVPMAAFSVAASYFLYKFRPQIRFLAREIVQFRAG